jgi:C-terminal processing protease CtpA/Prc
VKLAVVRDGKRLDITATRVETVNRRAGLTHDLPGETFQRLSPEVAYLKLSSVTLADVPSYIERARDAKVLVVDIRNYPSAFMVFSLGQHLVNKSTPFARFTQGEAQNPGTFAFRAGASIEPKAPFFEGRVVILVDEVSQSQSEYTTMALRNAPDAIVVGSTTAGADGNVSPIPLPGGLRAMISGIGVFYPDKRPTQRVGIIPELTVRPTIAGIRDGRDEVLEAGVSRALGRPWQIPVRQ